VIVYHVVCTNSDDYKERRGPYREAHLQRLLALRSQGVVIGVALRADLSAADCFFRVNQPSDVETLAREDPYFKGGVWTGYTLRTFGQFVEPWKSVDPVFDGSRKATMIEGAPSDPEMAAFALIELRGKGRMAFGGFLGDGRTLTLLNSPDPSEARTVLTETNLWSDNSLTAWSTLYVL